MGRPRRRRRGRARFRAAALICGSALVAAFVAGTGTSRVVRRRRALRCTPPLPLALGRTSGRWASPDSRSRRTATLLAFVAEADGRRSSSSPASTRASPGRPGRRRRGALLLARRRAGWHLPSTCRDVRVARVNSRNSRSRRASPEASAPSSTTSAAPGARMGPSSSWAASATGSSRFARTAARHCPPSRKCVSAGRRSSDRGLASTPSARNLGAPPGPTATPRPAETPRCSISPPADFKDLGLRAFFARYVPTGHLLYVAADGTLLAVAFDASLRATAGAPVALLKDLALSANDAGVFAVIGGRHPGLRHGIPRGSGRELTRLVRFRPGRSDPQPLPFEADSSGGTRGLLPMGGTWRSLCGTGRCGSAIWSGGPARGCLPPEMPGSTLGVGARSRRLAFQGERRGERGASSSSRTSARIDKPGHWSRPPREKASREAGLPMAGRSSTRKLNREGHGPLGARDVGHGKPPRRLLAG